MSLPPRIDYESYSLSHGLSGEITVPGDKSMSHRALMLGAIAEGQTSIHGFLNGQDCLSTLQAFRSMGVDMTTNNDTVIIHTNIQHASECTLELFNACSALADAGFLLNNRMTFLKGINDTAAAVKELNLKLLMMRVRPYLIYLHEVRSNLSEFLKVDKSTGIQILDSLRGWTSGLAVPHLIFCDKDNNKNPILPNYIKENNGDSYVFRNYKNLDFKYVNSNE